MYYKWTFKIKQEFIEEVGRTSIDGYFSDDEIREMQLKHPEIKWSRDV